MLRPIIIDVLNHWFRTDIFTWIIPNYSITYAFAFIVVLSVYTIRSSKVSLNRFHAFWSGIWAIAFGLIGARLYYLLLHPDAVIRSPSQILIGGTGSVGGYICGALGLILSLRIYQAPTLKYMDVAASSLGLGIFIGRIGCFLSGCCFGKIANLPWAVRFPKGSLPYIAHLSEGLISSAANLSLPIHPVQLYASLNGLLLFMITSWFRSHLQEHPGATFLLFWLMFCVTRFILEYFRGDKIRGSIGPLSTPQFLCLLFTPLLISGLLWTMKITQGNNNVWKESWY